MWFTESMHNVPYAIPVWFAILYGTYKLNPNNKDRKQLHEEV